MPDEAAPSGDALRMTGFRLGSVLGFEVRIDFSWFIIFFLLLWSFSVVVFPAYAPGLRSSDYFMMGLAGTLLFFATLLAHELAHSVVARRKGIPVDGITLFIFGGMAHTRSEAEGPGDEFQIAVVGPLMSLALALLLVAVAWAGGQVGWSPAVTGVALYIGLLNFLLAIFNLLPGFPLDGGRLFRSAVWKATGSLTRATRVASVAGRWLGLLLVAAGIWMTFGGNVIGGLWLVFIGWFLRNAAIASYQQHLLESVMRDITVRDAMTAAPETVPADLPVDRLVDDYFMRKRYVAFPVVDDAGRPLGIVALNQVKGIPREEWPRRTARDIMAPIGATPATDPLVVHPHENMDTVLRKLRDSPVRRLLVLRDGRLEGIVTLSDISGWVEKARQLQPD
jgi:Zn-dependent protease/predicted transcriptional regulator